MKIILNNTQFNLDVANTFYKKLIGLMGKDNIHKGLFIPKCRSIHTFLMKEEIDIIMINKDNEIIFYQKNVPKNKIIIKKKAYHTIELPKNSLKEITIGDKLTIKS